MPIDVGIWHPTDETRDSEDNPFARRLSVGQLPQRGCAGGYTALVAGGAMPDITLAAAHCERHPEEFVCRLGMIEDIGDSARPY